MFEIPTELIASLGVGGALLVYGGVALIRNWSDTNKERAKDEAEASLYENLSAENNRMSNMLISMSTQINLLLQDNSALINRVTALESSIKELSVWEDRAHALQKELILKDQVIAELQIENSRQAAIIEKISKTDLTGV